MRLLRGASAGDRRRIAARLAAIGLTVASLLLPGCGKTPAPTPAAQQAAAQATLRPAERPVDAVLLLRDRVLARDGAGFARLAVPPALHRELESAWSDGRSRWPLDELPLDGRILPMLAALQAPAAQATLMRTFRKQFAGADRDIDEAVRTLVVFGSQYVGEDPALAPAESDHTAQALEAIGDWALKAPLADPNRAERFFTALVAAAQRTGIDAAAGDGALARLGMRQSLNRLGPFFATLLAQLHQQYGLDLDTALRGLRASLAQQTGDRAELRVRYTLAGRPVDALVPVVRINGHWYVADYVQRARRAVGAPPP